MSDFIQPSATASLNNLQSAIRNLPSPILILKYPQRDSSPEADALLTKNSWYRNGTKKPQMMNVWSLRDFGLILSQQQHLLRFHKSLA
jgi:hypothetical protein